MITWSDDPFLFLAAFALVLANLPVYGLLRWLWFRSGDEFRTSLQTWLSPDGNEAVAGHMGAVVSELKLAMWTASCFVCVAMQAYYIDQVTL